MPVLRHDGSGRQVFAEQSSVARARAGPRQLISYCPEFDSSALALAATDPSLDPGGIDFNEVHFVAVN